MSQPFTQAIPLPTQSPSITSAVITNSATAGEFDMTITGSFLGYSKAFSGTSSNLSIKDTRTGATAGPSGSAPVDVTEWSDSQITVSFSQPSSGAQFGYGDSIALAVTNPQAAGNASYASSANYTTTMPQAPQNTISNDVTLSLNNQSLWTGSSAGYSFNYFLGPQWQGNSYSTSVGPLTFAAGYGPGKVGLSFSGELSTGAANAQYPVDAQLTAPAQASGGNTVTVQTGFGKQGGTASIQATAPDFGLQLSLVAQASFNASISANLPWPLGAVNIASVNPSVNFSDPLLEAGISGISGSVDLPAGFSIGYDLTSDAFPTAQQTANVSGGLDTVTATGQGSDFVSVNEDMVALAAALAPPPLDAALAALDGGNVSILGQEVSYSILQAILTGGLHLTESVSLIPKVTVTLTSNNGQTESGYLGQAFSFAMPKSGPLQISESLSLAGSQLSTSWGIGADLTGNVPVLSGSADILGQQLNFGPLVDFSGTLFNSGTLANIISEGPFTVSSGSSIVPAYSIANAITINDATTTALPILAAQTNNSLVSTPLLADSFASLNTLSTSLASGTTSSPSAGTAFAPTLNGGLPRTASEGKNTVSLVADSTRHGTDTRSFDTGFVVTGANINAAVFFANFSSTPSVQVSGIEFGGLDAGLLPNVLESPLAVGTLWNA
jgi:hypothetical protein